MSEISYLNRSDLPRGLRNNNPGNIRKGQPWQGRIVPGSDPAFDQFISVQSGLRAMLSLLITYIYDYKLKTITGIISRYAPVSENHTDKYIKYVSEGLRVDPRASITWDKQKIIQLARLMVDIEIGTNNSIKYLPSIIWEQSWALLPESKKKTVGNSETVKTQQLAGINWIFMAMLLLFFTNK